MAATIGKLSRNNILKANSNIIFQQVNNFSSGKVWSSSQKKLLTSFGVVAGGTGALLFALDQSVKASGTEVHPQSRPWSHNGVIASLDHASVRRGYEVYKNVCAACHSMQYIAYRHLVNVTHTEAEAKAEAEEVMVEDGPDDQGNYFKRPGKLSDPFPSPYPNEEAARAANNGAYPPDLSYITLARHGGEDYIFSLLTGYCDAPGGIVLREGQYFNPYFVGGAISMAQALYNEAIEYQDGTPATASQLAKDVSTFLKWTAEPEHDTRKRMFIKVMGILTLLFIGTVYMRKHIWTTMKTRKIALQPRINGKKE